jgi:glycosyltransferase involved in cell wall biosynthesis
MVLRDIQSTPETQESTRPCRVVHIIPHLLHGGAERMAVHVMTNLDPARFHVAAISLRRQDGTDLERILEKEGIKVYYLGKGAGFDPRMFTRVYRALSEFRPDVVHTHVHVLRYALPALLAKRHPAVLHTVHNIAEGEVEPRARWIQRLAFRAGIVPVSVAHEVAASVERMYGIPPGLVVQNCIPVSSYRNPKMSRAEWRQRAGFREDQVLLGCIAQFRPQKNHVLLLEAFAAGPARQANAHLILAGRGETEEAAKRRTAELGISSQVHFLGLREDIPEVLGAIDAFVMASDFEGSPLAVMDAMAAGLPVATTRVGGVPEILDSGKEGIVVAAGDARSLADAMLVLTENPEMRRRMGAAGADRASKSLDLPIMAGEYAKIYARLFAQSQSR